MANRRRAGHLEPGMVVSSIRRARHHFSHEQVVALERVPGFTEKCQLLFASGNVAEAYYVEVADNKSAPALIDVDGIPITKAKVAEAISILEKGTSTAIVQQLRRTGNPLWLTDYNGIAREFRSKHPELEVPKGTPKKHAAHQRVAFVYYLKEKLGEQPSSGLSPVDQAVTAAAAEMQEEAATEPPPPDDYDARKRVYRQIVARRGQLTFRSKLIKAYSGRCAITGYDVEATLEAAHLHPYRLSGTQYQFLSGIYIAEPVLKSQRPTTNTLNELWHQFQLNELGSQDDNE